MMTRFSTPSTTDAENITDLTSKNYPIEEDSSDWEARMAKLVGFVEESTNVDGEVAADSATLQPPLSPTPEVRTEQPFASNPFAKLGLVGTGMLAIVLLAGGFLSQLMSGSNQKPNNNIIISSAVRSQPKNESPPQALEQEVETLKTKLALTEQVEDVKAAQRTLRTAKLTLSPQTVSAQVTRIPTPVRTVYVPRTVKVERIVKVPYTQPTLRDQLPPPLPSQIPVVKPEQPLANITPPPTPTPLDEWSRLAKLGSYGQVSITDKPNVNPTSYQTARNSNGDVQQAAKNPNINRVQPQVAAVVNPARQQSTKSVAVGSSTKAVLATAIFGQTTKSSNRDKNQTEDDNKNVFVVRLQEPLKAVDGSIAIPAKTELLAEIDSISDQGLLQLNVVKMVLQNNGNFIEQSLPANTIMLRGTQGKPLIGQQFPNRSSSIASLDIGLFVLGGLGKAAELINRTQSEVITTTSGSTIINNSNPRNDISAGILEGGIKTIVPQITQRNQQAISQMTQRTNIWFLPAGTEVELYINQNLSI
jgi:hypothetical protein